MTINEFLKAIQKNFGKVEYKATSKDGQTFKSKGWDHAQMEFNKRQFSRVSRETNKS
jgi:hypothetical protein